jgi:hypothetical protein
MTLAGKSRNRKAGEEGSSGLLGLGNHRVSLLLSLSPFPQSYLNLIPT